MKKQRCICLFLTFVLIVGSLAGCKDYKFPPGRDTVDIYGDGTFQVMRGKELSLHYCPTGAGVIDDIEHYWKVGQNVFFIGQDFDQNRAYGILTPKTNTLQLCLVDGYREYVSKEAVESGDIVLLPDFASFTPKEQAVFMEREKKDISQYPAYIPVIESFSSTAYQYDGYPLGEIKSVQFLYDGESTNLSADDPRILRLLNAISFSAMRGHTAIRSEPVSEYEFKTYLEADTYLLDIEFQTEGLPDVLKANHSVCRMIVCANRILVVDESGYTELHSPFQYVLKDPNKGFSDAAWQEIAAAVLWGDREYLDLLWYADLVTYNIQSGTVSPNP